MTQSKTVLDILYEESGPETKKKIRIYTFLSLIALSSLFYLIVRQFYSQGQLDSEYWFFFRRWTTWRFILSGLAGTVAVTACSLTISFILAFSFMFLRVRGNKASELVCSFLVEFTRGVPTLLFVYFFFFVIPLMGIKLHAFWKIAIPVAISASGAVSEVLRGGVNAVSKGQREAALSLGMSENRTFFRIIFPQAFSFVLPSLISELVIILKDTTFAYIVSYNDLMQNASVLISNYDALLSVYLIVGIIYIIINYLLNKLSVKIAERRK